jgi:hypothetical protein
VGLSLPAGAAAEEEACWDDCERSITASRASLGPIPCTLRVSLPLPSDPRRAWTLRRRARGGFPTRTPAEEVDGFARPLSGARLEWRPLGPKLALILLMIPQDSQED